MNDFQQHQVVPSSQGMPTAQDDLEIMAYVRLALRRNGSMSIEGHIGDKDFVLALLANAVDAIHRQVPDNDKLFIPGNDTDIPAFGNFTNTPTRKCLVCSTTHYGWKAPECPPKNQRGEYGEYPLEYLIRNATK